MTTANERQLIRGACPATGRSASACLDQTHAACVAGQVASIALDRVVEAQLAQRDEA